MPPVIDSSECSQRSACSAARAVRRCSACMISIESGCMLISQSSPSPPARSRAGAVPLAASAEPSASFPNGVRPSPKVSLPVTQPAGPSERLGSALTNPVRAADDLAVKLALVLIVSHTSTIACSRPPHQTLLVVGSRRVRVAAIVRTERGCVGPGVVRLQGGYTSLGIDRRRDPPRSAITTEFASPTRCHILLGPRHRLQAFPSLCWVRAQRNRARTPARSIRSGRVHRAGGVTPVEVRRRPRSQISNPRLSPRGAGRAVGGIRAQARES